MKINGGVICMLAVFVFAASPTVSLARRSGSHGGGASGSHGGGASGSHGSTAQGSHASTAHPTAASAATHAPATVTRGTFAVNPSSTRMPMKPGPGFIPGRTSMPSTSHGVFGSNRVFTPNQAFMPNQLAGPEDVFDQNLFQPQVTVPTHILDPGQTIILPTVPPIPPVVQPVVLPVRPQFGPLAGSTQSTPLLPEMSREEVLRQFGQPSGSIATRTSETLFFDGGLKIILENGQVTGAR